MGEVPRGAGEDALAGRVEWGFAAVLVGDRAEAFFYAGGICEPHARAARFFTGFAGGG